MTSSLRTKAPARRGVVVVFAVCLPCLMFGLEISSIPAILPTLEHLLHASFEQLQWVMNAYTIAVTTVLMAAGTLADRYGRKRVFLISIVGFGLASLTCGVAQNVATLIVARFLQGLCGGAMLIAQIAVLSHAFQEGRERAVAWGWWGVASGIGLGFGPIVGGAIVAVSNWGWVFLIHVLFAALALVLAASGVDESNDPQAGSIDIVGISALSLSVLCLVWYITQGADVGFGSPIGLAILGGSVASLVGFVFAEKASRRPIFDLSVFRIRPFSGAIVGSAAMNLSYWPFMCSSSRTGSLPERACPSLESRAPSCTRRSRTALALRCSTAGSAYGSWPGSVSSCSTLNGLGSSSSSCGCGRRGRGRSASRWSSRPRRASRRRGGSCAVLVDNRS